jgi:hypothetical protein
MNEYKLNIISTNSKLRESPKEDYQKRTQTGILSSREIYGFSIKQNSTPCLHINDMAEKTTDKKSESRSHQLNRKGKNSPDKCNTRRKNLT